MKPRADLDVNGVGGLVQPRVMVDEAGKVVTGVQQADEQHGQKASRKGDKRPIIPLGRSALDSVCPDLAKWPELWKIENSDVVVGQRIIEFLEPFLTELSRQGLADKTLARHCDHLEMLGGELIRRRQAEPDLAKQGVEDLLLTLIEEDGGPLLWPRISETAQRSFDATYRKLYRFLQH